MAIIFKVFNSTKQRLFILCHTIPQGVHNLGQLFRLLTTQVFFKEKTLWQDYLGAAVEPVVFQN
jgi:hypothetical protein